MLDPDPFVYNSLYLRVRSVHRIRRRSSDLSDSTFESGEDVPVRCGVYQGLAMRFEGQCEEGWTVNGRGDGRWGCSERGKLLVLVLVLVLEIIPLPLPLALMCTTRV